MEFRRVLFRSVLAGGSRAGPVPRRVCRAYPVVSRLPGPVGVLGDHAHRRVRRLRGVPPDNGADPRLPVRPCGAPAGDHHRSCSGYGGVHPVPAGARGRSAVCRTGAAGSGRRSGGHRTRRRAAGPAPGREPGAAGDKQRGHRGSGPRRAGNQRAGPVRPGPDDPGVVAAAGRLPGRDCPDSRDAGAGNRAPRSPGLAKTGRQRAAPGPGHVRAGRTLPGGRLALGGFYLSLGTSLAAQLSGSHNLLWGGVITFLLTGLGAVTASAFRNSAPIAVMLGGCLGLLGGAAVTIAAIVTSTPALLLLLLGTVLAGL